MLIPNFNSYIEQQSIRSSRFYFGLAFVVSLRLFRQRYTKLLLSILFDVVLVVIGGELGRTQEKN